MTVGSICRRPAVTATREQTLLEAAQQMERDGVGSVVVAEDGRPLGILTDRDVALWSLSRGVDPTRTPVIEVAAAPVVSLREELPVSQASDRMRTHGLRRVPVIDAQGRVVGMVSSDDLVRLIAEELRALADVAAEQTPAGVREAVTSPNWFRGVRHYAKPVVTAERRESVRDVAQRMERQCVGCVVVTDEEGSPVGIITDRNLALRAVARSLDPDAAVAEAVMTRVLVRVDAGVPLQEVARVMSEQAVRRVPVVVDGRIAGIVSYDDILVALGRELHDLGEAARGSMARGRG